MRCTPSRTRYLGEKVLEHDKETLETIKQAQEKSVVDFCIEKIGQKIITSCGDNSKETWSELSKFLIEDYLLLPTLWDYRSSTYNKDAAKNYWNYVEPQKVNLSKF